MNNPTSSPSIAPTKPTFACVRCSERKVKCDKQTPCNACARHNVQCIYLPPKPSRRKRNFGKDEMMRERLKHYEVLLRDNGIEPHHVSSTSEAVQLRKSTTSSSRSVGLETIGQLPTPISTVSEPQTTVFKPQLLHGQRGTELVDNNLWSRVAEELHDAEDALEDSANEASDGASSNGDFAYVLGRRTSITASSHPPTELIHQLWQTFVENVNPLSKIVHVPSLQYAIEKAIINIERIPRGFEALMFAIYSMAVLSLTEDECKERLGETRAILLPHYVAATKAALSRAKFMSSTSIVVLQALVLHILSIRDSCESRAMWSLTGVAIRVAEGMGMRIDGALLGLSPFEAEIRRRIWWQLRMHDFRAAELCGQAKFRDFELDETTPKKPANVNDSDLYPTMPQAPVESPGPTEMMWCVLRTDLATFASIQKAKLQKQGKTAFTSEDYTAMDDLKIKDDFIKEMEDLVETKYLRFCDPSQPLQFMTLLGGRLSNNLVRFIAHHPRRWAHLDHVPTSEQQLVWKIAFQLLEQFDMMQSNPQLRRFAWSVPYFIQWHAVIHVLDTLRADPLHVDAVKAWRLIDALYNNNSELLLSTKRPIFMAVGNLCLKAFSARVTALTRIGKKLSNPPEYISKLREQREAAKSRREAVMARSKGQVALDGEKRLVTTDTEGVGVWPDKTASSAEALLEAQLLQYATPKQPASTLQGNTRREDDAFWLSEALDDGFSTGGAADMMNLDMDTILAQDCLVDSNPNGEAIDWAQWDAWLGNLEPVRPTFGAGSG